MSIFKCKICGGTLEITSGKTVATCEYCGTKQTLPKLDDEKKANLFDRANHFRRNNDFDKAMGIYEQILNEDTEDAESYWSIVLCRYGIEYVEDPSSRKRVPTVNRAQFTSVFDDEDYKSAIKYADANQRELYEKEATTINEIQKGILAISGQEEPFDVFICYKETDANGRRTQDSVLATELYHELTREGYKVFFSRITLEDKLGTAYEPYIFAALNSSKVMVVLGTRPEHFNAVWVRNEWSRYLALIKQGQKKMLIPAYRDMDPYDLPEEFSHLQAQDMSKLGFMQDLVRGITKLVSVDNASLVKETVVVQSTTSGNASALVKRGFLALEDGDWNKADEFFEQALNQNAEDAQAYLGKLMAELQVKTKSSLKNCKEPFDNSTNYQKAIRFADSSLVSELKGYISFVKDRNAKKAKEEYNESIYLRALEEYKSSDVGKLNDAIELFSEIADWKNSKELIGKCQAKIEQIRVQEENERIERERLAEEKRLENERQNELKRIAKEKADRRNRKITIIATPIVGAIVIFVVILNAIIIPNYKYNVAVELMNECKYQEAILAFEELGGYKDSESKIKETKYNEAVSLMYNGKLAEAKEILNAINGFGQSYGKLMVIHIIENLDKVDYNYIITKLLGANEQITLNINLNGGTSTFGESITLKSLDEYQNLAYPEHVGYRLANMEPVSHNVSEDGSLSVALDTVWADDYLITYDLDGGKAENPEVYRKDGETISLKNPTKTGYTFLGWSGTDIDGMLKEVTIPAGSWGNKEFTANWEVNTYTITLNSNGGNIDTKSLSVGYGENYTLPTPTRAHYTFDGWYNGKQKYQSGKWNELNDVILIANWIPTTYKITYNLDGATNASNNPSMFTNASGKITLNNPNRRGYNFLGWYSDKDFKNKITEIKSGTTNNLTLWAKWELATYTITYNLEGGTVNNLKTTFTINDLPIKLSNPTKNGYSFVGWYNRDTKCTSVDDIGDKVIEAKWKPISYSVTYNLDGGTNDSGNPKIYTVETNISLQAPAKRGYNFLGWYSDKDYKNKISEIKVGTTQNMTLWAKWELATYTITYNLNGGTASNLKKSFTINDLPIKLANPAKKGYAFWGWYNESEKCDLIEDIGNIFLSAKFVKADEYINFGPYEWLILEANTNKLLVIAKYAITLKKYNNSWKGSTGDGVHWANCDLEEWLNNDFLKRFSSNEKSMISTVTVPAHENPTYNSSNPDYSSNPGIDVQDKVFLLSVTEFKKYFATRNSICKPLNDNDADIDGNCSWWLRTPGINNHYAVYVNGGGGVSDINGDRIDNLKGVRPAMWIDLNS